MSTDDTGDRCGHDDCGCATDGGTDTFHPMGSSWQNEMQAMLDDTEYDTELGMDMARDAQRLVAGEITEQEFHEQYHDAVVAEFGVDDRPTAEAVEDEEEARGLFESLRNLDEKDEESRREVMKKMGAGAAFLGLGGAATWENSRGPEETEAAGAVDAAQSADEGEGIQWGMVIDLERCDGCLACVQGCIEENGTSSGANWMYVLTYEDERTDQENFLVRPCQHCTNAPCEKVCPVTARHKREKDGLVLTDYDICIGCRYCQVACPYGVNYFQWGEPDVPFEDIDEMHTRDDRDRWVDSRPPRGTMGKCTMCPTRQDGIQGEDMIGTTACMDACDTAGMSAIHFGDMNDPESRPQRYLARRAEQETDQSTEFDDVDEDNEAETTVTGTGKLSAFKLLEDIGTQPNVVYLGNEPGPEAHQVEGPVPYENLSPSNGVEVVDRRKDVLDEGAARNDVIAGDGGD